MPKINDKYDLGTHKEWVLLYEEHRQWDEAQRAKLEEQGLSAEQIADALPRPVLEVIWRHMQETGWKGDDGFKRAIIELVRRKIPLDDWLAQYIADDLEYLYFPTHRRTLKRKHREREAHAMIAEELIDLVMRGEGVTREAALERVAPSLGKPSSEALRIFLMRRKRRK